MWRGGNVIKMGLIFSFFSCVIILSNCVLKMLSGVLGMCLVVGFLEIFV